MYIFIHSNDGNLQEAREWRKSSSPDTLGGKKEFLSLFPTQLKVHYSTN